MTEMEDLTENIGGWRIVRQSKGKNRAGGNNYKGNAEGTGWLHRESRFRSTMEMVARQKRHWLAKSGKCDKLMDKGTLAENQGKCRDLPCWIHIK